MAVAKRTDKIIVISTNAVDDIHQGRGHSAKKNLHICKKEGTLLLEQVRQLSKQITPLKPYFKEKEFILLREKETLENELSQLKNDILRCHEVRCAYEKELQTACSSLEKAQKDRSYLVAEQKELQARMDRYNIIKFIPVIGQIAWLVEQIKDDEGKLKEANRSVSRNETKIQELRDSISDCKETINHQNSRLSEVDCRISAIASQCSELSSNHRNLCHAIANLNEAEHTLEEFIDITEHGNNSTELLEQLVTLANKLGGRKSGEELKGKQYFALTNDYLATWNELKDLIESVQLSFQLTFKCSMCCNYHNGLPHLYNNDLFCERCWRR